MLRVEYTNEALGDLRKIDFQESQRIIRKIHFFSLQDKPLSFAKKLKEHALGTYRFRIGDYRALFDVDTKGTIHILMILRVRHRKDAYRV